MLANERTGTIKDGKAREQERRKRDIDMRRKRERRIEDMQKIFFSFVLRPSLRLAESDR